ncbi:MAG: hypothetical protein NT175_04530 [Bacteroidetes bacterium]|nr:hypothetical protein [Bacteroidota bacterium]
MKRILVFIATVILLAVTLSSCKTREKCPAYGESHKYQVEQRY